MVVTGVKIPSAAAIPNGGDAQGGKGDDQGARSGSLGLEETDS